MIKLVYYVDGKVTSYLGAYRVSPSLDERSPSSPDHDDQMINKVINSSIEGI